MWDFAPLANGNDVIVSEATGKVLDGGGSGINPGEASSTAAEPAMADQLAGERQAMTSSLQLV